MRIGAPGKIADGLWFLGREESGIYLLESRDEAMIISGGMRYIVPHVMRQLREFKIDREKISKLLILHAHFDHVGIVPFFKRSLHGLDVFASRRAWEILSLPKAIHTINEFSRSAAKRMESAESRAEYDLDWQNDMCGNTVSEGDVISLGDFSVQILETPGHSSCSISAYVPQLKALFPSDGGGIPFEQTIITLGNSDYTQFQKSLEKLSRLEVSYLCADHYGYITGQEAATFIPRSMRIAAENRERMEAVYTGTGDIDSAAGELADSFYKEHQAFLLPPEITHGIYRQMVRHIAGALEERQGI